MLALGLGDARAGSGRACLRRSMTPRAPRADRDLLHVRVGRVEQLALARPWRSRDGVGRAGGAQVRALERIDRDVDLGRRRRVPAGPTFSPMYSMGASSRSPSPITTVPRMSSASKARRIASTAAWSARSSSPRPIRRADGEGGRLGDADHFEREVAIHRSLPCRSLGSGRRASVHQRVRQARARVPRGRRRRARCGPWRARSVAAQDLVAEAERGAPQLAERRSRP